MRRLCILLTFAFILLGVAYAALANPIRAQSPDSTPTPASTVTPLFANQKPYLSGVVLLSPSTASLQTLRPLAPASAASSNLRMNPNDASNKFQNEVTIAIDPNNPLNIVAGANDARVPNSVARSGYYASTDGGLTWSDGILPFPSNAQSRGDPALVFDNTHNVFYAGLGLNSSNFSNCDPASGLYVARSTVGGTSWETATEIAANSETVFHDKPSIAADRSGGIYSGTIYVAWNADTMSPTLRACNAFVSPYPIVLKYTRDAGANWSDLITVTLPEQNCSDGASAAVGADGAMYVAFGTYAGAGCGLDNWIMLAKSTDGGVTFTENYSVTQINWVGSVAATTTNSIRINSFPNLAADPSDANNLFLVWTNGCGGCTDIMFTRSTNGGLTWSAPVRLNDDAADGRDHFFPAIAVAPNGTIFVSWYDRRSSVEPTNPYLYNEFITFSTDHGLTWAQNMRVSDVSSDPASYNMCLSSCTIYFIGDYSGLAVVNDRVAYPSWTDTRDGGDQNPYTARFNLLAQKFLRFPLLLFDQNP